MHLNFNRRARVGFTIIEIIVIFIIIALMLIIIVPHFLLEFKGRKAGRVKADLVTLNDAIEHYALDSGKSAGAAVQFADLRKYVNPQSDAYKLNGKDAFGDSYGPFIVGKRLTVPSATAEKLNSVKTADYWSPYQ